LNNFNDISITGEELIRAIQDLIRKRNILLENMKRPPKPNRPPPPYRSRAITQPPLPFESKSPPRNRSPPISTVEIKIEQESELKEIKSKVDAFTKSLSSARLGRLSTLEGVCRYFSVYLLGQVCICWKKEKFHSD
jgi:hypothetical protein